MSFAFEFNYPNNEKPEFSVLRLEGGYQFIFYNEDGSEDTASRFAIGEHEMKPNYKATGYQGKQGMAIQIFRENYKL